MTAIGPPHLGQQETILFACVLIGMSSKYLWDLIEIKKKNAGLQPGEPRFPLEFDFWDFVQPFLGCRDCVLRCVSVGQEDESNSDPFQLPEWVLLADRLFSERGLSQGRAKWWGDQHGSILMILWPCHGRWCGPAVHLFIDPAISGTCMPLRSGSKSSYPLQRQTVRGAHADRGIIRRNCDSSNALLIVASYDCSETRFASRAIFWKPRLFAST